MEWSEEEVKAAEEARKHARATDGTVTWDAQSRAMMTSAVELAAARGGTMTAKELDAGLGDIAEVCLRRDLAVEIRSHISALGARNAVLEAERDDLRQRLAALTSAASDMSAHVDKTAGGTSTHGDYGGELREEYELVDSNASEDACEHLANWYVQVGTDRFECSMCRRIVPDALAWKAARRFIHGSAPTPRRTTLAHLAWSEDQRRGYEDGWDKGAEAMRAACILIVDEEMMTDGISGCPIHRRIKERITGAAT